MNKSAAALLILVFLFPMFLNGTNQGAVAEAEADGKMRFGVNYLSTHYHYEQGYLSNETLERDFSLFQEQGLEYITLCAVWKYLEPERGVYNDGAIDDLMRVCSVAVEHDLKVIIDFHTMMNEGSWTMPTWLVPQKFEAVFLNETARQAWLNFLDHCAARLNDSDSIWSWNMMNEPARREWACNVTIDDFLQLWAEMKTVFKAYSDRPVSVRFAAQVFENPDHFNCDSRIYDAFDYLALNWYEYYYPSENFTHVVLDAQQNGCPVILTEFGSNATSDIEQASDFQRHLALFKSLGLTACIGWMWRADYTLGNPGPPSVGYNLAKDENGTPRPSFLLLAEDPPEQPVYIRTDGSIDPATAPIQRKDDLYTLTEDVRYVDGFNGIVVERNDVVLNGANHFVEGIESFDAATGVLLEGRENVTIANMTVRLFVRCIAVHASTGISILGNNIMGNGRYNNGLLLNLSSNNVISRNNITNNYYEGVTLISSNFNTFSENYVANTNEDVRLMSSSSNTFFHNNFARADSPQVIFDGLSASNVWDDGYPSGGNYWSDYAGSDSDGDGIGDTPYTIDGNNQDHYPLTTLWKPSSESYLAVRGNDNAIYYRTRMAGSWGNWKALPSGTTYESPAITVCQGKLYFTVTGIDGHSIWYSRVDLNTEAFSGWTLLDGACNSAPRLASNGTHVFLAVRGLDNCVYWRTYDASADSWGSWTGIPGATGDRPAAAVLGNNLHLAVTGIDGTSVWHGHVSLADGSFSGWTNLPGAAGSAPALASATVGTLYLSVRGLGGEVYVNERSGGVWQGWNALPTGLTGKAPAVAVTGNTLHFVVSGVDGASIWHSTIDLNTHIHSGWTLLVGITPSAPTLTR
jgi:parallel beta-helix repeat protein